MDDNYKCRVCGSINTLNLGSLPKQTHFAGRLMQQSLPESFLYECNDCSLVVRHPILSTSQYNTLYEQASSKVWSSSNVALRYDQIVVKNFILKRNKSNDKVLDVGCYTADLLKSLPESYKKYGVEMSLEAALVAKEKGIKVVGNDLYKIVTNEKFDVITAVDVIEHIHNPEEFIRNLAMLLEPNGQLIVSSGNTDSWLWKNLKNRFWYSKFPEHISFIGINWLNNFCKKNNFKIIEVRFFTYVPNNISFIVKNMVKCIFSLIRINPERFSNTTKDHFCFVISKNLI
jgi:2-polyprenyl-3-methyl-5-hydroxy-6-metoxy-1,4-benzoquinol methylase